MICEKMALNGKRRYESAFGCKFLSRTTGILSSPGAVFFKVLLPEVNNSSSGMGRLLNTTLDDLIQSTQNFDT